MGVAKSKKISQAKPKKAKAELSVPKTKPGLGEKVIWKPQPRQERALSCPADELFFGGAAGGGKSDFLLVSFTRGLQYGSKHKGVIFRRSYKELEELIERSHELYRPLGGNFMATVKTWQFPAPGGGAGASLKFRFLESDLDVHDYQGNQYTHIAWDELTNWATDYCYVYLLSRLRSPHGIPCRVVSAGNPGGPGHQWVKRRFIDPSPADTVFKVTEMINNVKIESTRCFIPSKLEDNQVLMQNDPRYEQRLAMLPKNLYRALREGDWNVFEGQVFSEFSTDKHVVEPFPLDPDWYRFCSMDWGYSKPFSIGWWAVTGDGRMIRYREWYGSDSGENKGIEWSAVAVARKAMEMSAADGVSVMVADPACWNNQGTGTTIAEVFEQAGWQMEKAVNDRMNGLMQFHNKLKTKGSDGRPMMLIFNTCTDFIRTIPMLPYDPRHPEDVDTTAEDHVYDDARYAVLSRLAGAAFSPRRYRRQKVEEHRSVYQWLDKSGLWA